MILFTTKLALYHPLPILPSYRCLAEECLCEARNHVDGLVRLKWVGCEDLPQRLVGRRVCKHAAMGWQLLVTRIITDGVGAADGDLGAPEVQVWSGRPCSVGIEGERTNICELGSRQLLLKRSHHTINIILYDLNDQFLHFPTLGCPQGLQHMCPHSGVGLQWPSPSKKKLRMHQKTSSSCNRSSQSRIVGQSTNRTAASPRVVIGGRPTDESHGPMT